MASGRPPNTAIRASHLRAQTLENDIAVSLISVEISDSVAWITLASPRSTP